MKISYAITVHNEIFELTKLINFLHPNIDTEDEIVIQYDEPNVTTQVLDYLKVIESLHTQIKIVPFPLNKDFASYKNNLKKHCSGDYIFQIDADEIPSEFLIANLKTILSENNVDLIFVPRVNTVDGITQAHIDKWGWRLNERGWVNFPDYQTRIYRNTNEVEWFGKVHERISGYNNFSSFPPQEEFSLYHHKDIKRQEHQNNLYNTIIS
jgi:glycosyltransferase involved in cell wall biosynthesis